MAVFCDWQRQMCTLLILFGMSLENNVRNRLCHAPEVTEGQTGIMMFFIDKNLNFSSDSYFANLIRSDVQDWDLLSCDQPSGTSNMSCTVNSSVYKSEGIKDHRLTVYIPNVTQHFADTYVFQAYVNGKAQPPVFCSLSVKTKPPPVEKSVVTTQSTTAGWVIAGALGVMLLVVIVPVGVFLQRRRFCGSVNNDQSNQVPLLRHWGRNKDRGSIDYKEHERKRWFHKSFTDRTEEKILQSDRTKEGSFLVTVGTTNPDHLLLAVYFSGVLKRFPISKEKDGFKLLDTEEFFRTVTLLVNHYKEHDIRVGGTVWGTLSKPFRIKPDENWYFGEITREDEKKVLQTSTKKSGSFLIRDGITEPDDYVLAVYFEEEMKHFTIIEEEERFYFRDMDSRFKTLTELVDFYKEHPISVADREYGELSTPFEKMQLDTWYLETFTAYDDSKFLSSSRKRPGSFLVAVGTNNPNRYILAVHFEDAVKRFPISREGNGYTLLDTGRTFRTLPGLLNYYKEHEIKVGAKVWGKLTNRFRMEPEESWYFGKSTREDENKLLQTGKQGPGSFLIRDGVTDPDNYVLAVYCDGIINHFTIIPEENGFKLRDTGTVHRTLSDLVVHYKENVITVGGKDYCQLVKPFEK